MAHTIHVFYIYLQLVDFYGKMQVNIPLPWILWASSGSVPGASGMSGTMATAGSSMDGASPKRLIWASFCVP